MVRVAGSFMLILASVSTAFKTEPGQQETALAASTGQMRLFFHQPPLGKPFKATAYLRPARFSPWNLLNRLGCRSRIELTLPPGVSLAPGETLSKPVPPPNQSGISQVSWQMIVISGGDYPVKAAASCGTTTTANVRARECSLE